MSECGEGPRLERGNDVGSIDCGSLLFYLPLFKVIGEYSIILTALIQTLLIFCCLAGTTLIREVRMVFEAVDRSLDEGRKQVARIVGRDTSALSAQEVRTAALETLAEI